MGAFSIARWGAGDDSFAFQYARGILMASVMFLQFDIREESVLEHVSSKCHL